MTLLQRLASGLSRTHEEEAPEAPQQVYQAPQQQAPAQRAPAPQQPDLARRPQAPVYRPAQGQLDQQGRPVVHHPRGLEDDQLEIPAFLRRQAN